ncbi:MAG: hypothetical protein PHX48_07720 [Bacteroidales bacterium]|nr:hypothetical protein [Bacteroidales bacterium]
MKKLLFFFLINIVAISAFSQDWRKGNYMTSPPEYFVMVNLDGKMMMGVNKDLNPMGYGFTAGYQYKTGRKKGYVTTAHGLGGYLGYIYYRGSNFDVEPIGTPYSLTFSKYNSFGYVPVMLSYNFYITKKKMHYFIGLDAGIQLMIREKDYKNQLISYYNAENEITINHVLPSGKVYLGAMYELNRDFRLRCQVGLDYVTGHTFEAMTPFFYRDEQGNTVLHQASGKITTQGLFNVSASVGLVYSL